MSEEKPECFGKLTAKSCEGCKWAKRCLEKFEEGWSRHLDRAGGDVG